MENKTIKKPPKYSAADKRKIPFVCLLLILPLTNVAIFFFYQNFETIMLAFQDANGNYTLNTLKNVFEAFKEHGNIIIKMDPIAALKNSVIIWVTGNVFCNIVCLLTTYMMTKHTVGSKVFRVIYTIPGLVGAVIFSTIMKEVYAQGGMVIELLTNMGFNIPEKAIRDGLLSAKETAFTTLITQYIVLTIAGGGLIMAGAYERIPAEVFESAKIDGAGFFRETFQFAIPCAWPTISTMMIFSLCSIFTSDYGFYLYTNGNTTMAENVGLTSIGYYLYTMRVAMSQQQRPDLYVYSSAFGMVLTFMTIPVVIVGRWLLNKVETVEF